MAGMTLTTADKALKELYLPAIREQLSSKTVTLDQLEESHEQVEGRVAVLSLHVGRNSAVAFLNEGDDLPAAGAQAYIDERVSLHQTAGRIRLTDHVIQAMKSNAGSFIRAMKSETEGITRDLKRNLGRAVFGTSNGVLADARVTTALTVVNLAAATSVVQLRQIDVGAVIDIGTVASPTAVAQARTVTAVDFTNKTITISGAAVTTAVTDKIFRNASGGGSREITGLPTIVAASASLFNVDPATYPSWASTVSSNGGTPRAVSDTLFAAVVDDVEIASDEAPNLLVTSHGVARAFANTQTSNKRFVNTTELKGGWRAISVDTPAGELPLVRDRDCPTTQAFLLNTKHLTIQVNGAWDWMDEDGAVLSRVSGRTEYEAVLKRYLELTTDRRNAHGKVTDLIEA